MGCNNRLVGQLMRLAAWVKPASRWRSLRPQSGEASDKRLIKGGQGDAPAVVADGLGAGGGVWSIAVDPGVPLGPGFLNMLSAFPT